MSAAPDYSAQRAPSCMFNYFYTRKRFRYIIHCSNNLIKANQRSNADYMKDSCVEHHPIIWFYYLSYVISSRQTFWICSSRCYNTGGFIYPDCALTLDAYFKSYRKLSAFNLYWQHAQSSWSSGFFNLFVLILDDGMMFYRRVSLLPSSHLCLQTLQEEQPDHVLIMRMLLIILVVILRKTAPASKANSPCIFIF